MLVYYKFAGGKPLGDVYPIFVQGDACIQHISHETYCRQILRASRSSIIVHHRQVRGSTLNANEMISNGVKCPHNKRDIMCAKCNLWIARILYQVNLTRSNPVGGGDGGAPGSNAGHAK